METESEFDEVARRAWERAFGSKASEAVPRHLAKLEAILEDFAQSGSISEGEHAAAVGDTLARLSVCRSQGLPPDLGDGMWYTLGLLAKFTAKMEAELPTENEKPLLLWALAILAYCAAPRY